MGALKDFLDAFGDTIKNNPIKITLLLLGLIFVGLVIYWIADNWQAIKAFGPNVVLGAEITFWGVVAAALTGLTILAISFGVKQWKAQTARTAKARADAISDADKARASAMEAANAIEDPVQRQAAIDAANAAYGEAVATANGTKAAADASATTAIKGTMENITKATNAQPGTPDATLNIQVNGDTTVQIDQSQLTDEQSLSEQLNSQDITGSSTGDAPPTESGGEDIL